jgi:hypothetical protein
VRADIPPALTGSYAKHQQGYYLDVTRDFGAGWIPTMPQGAFTAKLRFDRVDFDRDAVGQHVEQGTAGLNFRPTRESVIKLDLVRGREFDRFNNRSDFVRLLASFATYF